jgi:hypothetical protein
MWVTMAAKKIPKSVIRAFMERHRMRSVSIVIEDVDAVRVDPNAPGSPTPPWRRASGPKSSGEQPS